jgi:hypothetical protein
MDIKKKAGAIDYPEVFDHAGLLINGPPDWRAALLLVFRRLQQRLSMLTQQVPLL